MTETGRMIPHEYVALVRHSHARIEPQAAVAGRLFYARLFEAHPTLRPLFHGSLESQGVKLMALLGSALDLLDRPGALRPLLRGLGRRHADYGVEPWHYDAVRDALLQTLADVLGRDFGEPERAAWRHVYGRIAHEMQSAAAAADHPLSFDRSSS